MYLLRFRLSLYCIKENINNLRASHWESIVAAVAYLTLLREKSQSVKPNDKSITLSDFLILPVFFFVNK